MQRPLLSQMLPSRRGPLLSDERGASAIEFALLLPILVFACMATVDLGLALNQKLELDQSLRAGAQGLMAGEYDKQPDPTTKVKKLVETIDAEASAADTNNQIETATNKIQVAVDRFCMCPEDLASKVDCTTKVCANSVKRYKFYQISGQQNYDTMYLPGDISLTGSILVQIE